MKLFFEEYGIATMLAIASLTLVTMTTPVGAAISDGLNTAVEQTRPESDQVKELNNKADKSVRALAGEDVTYEPEVVGFQMVHHKGSWEDIENSPQFSCRYRVNKNSGADKFGVVVADTANAGTISTDTMVVNSSNNYIKNYAYAVKDESKFTYNIYMVNNSYQRENSDMDGLTLKLSSYRMDNLTKKYSYRAYCTVGDKIIYSNNIYTTSMEEIANYVYYHNKCDYEEAHTYIYKNVLMPLSAQKNMKNIASYILKQLKSAGVVTSTADNGYIWTNKLYKDIGYYYQRTKGYSYNNDSSDKTFTYQDPNVFTSITLGRESDPDSDASKLLAMLNALESNKNGHNYNTLYEWIVGEVPEGSGFAVPHEFEQN